MSLPSPSSRVAGGALCRILAALIPLSRLALSKRILDGVQAHFSGRPLPPEFRYLVGAEFGLAVFGSLIGRAAGYFDALLADRFTRYVNRHIFLAVVARARTGGHG